MHFFSQISVHDGVTRKTENGDCISDEEEEADTIANTGEGSHPAPSDLKKSLL